jgi:hypothetical protein
MVLANGIKFYAQAVLWPLQVLYQLNQTGL